MIRDARPADLDARLRRIAHLADRGDIDAAWRAAMEAVGCYPQQSRAWTAAADMWLRLGHDEQAAHARSMALRLLPAPREGHGSLEDARIKPSRA